MSTATQAQNAHTPSTTASSNDSSSPEDQLWEGEKMFNIYIWDYCTKRGYANTARELVEEAKLGPTPRPPIDAKQGLLYEWWSVFWVLFAAKSNNAGTDDAMLYMHSHMQSRQVPGIQRYPNGIRAMPGIAPGAPGMPPTVPGHAPPGAGPMASVAHQQHPGQASNTHPLPNGIGAAPANQQAAQGATQQQSQQPGQQQQQTPLGFPAPNGVPQPLGRPMQGQPVRVPQGAFYSPTMAHPQTPAGAAAGPPPPYPGTNMYQQPMRAGMPPPGGSGVPAPNGVQGNAMNASSPGYAQGNSGSRAATPAQGQPGVLTNPSPNMPHHTVPQTTPNFGGVPPTGRGPPFEQQLVEISKIDPQIMNELRAELGLGNKDTSSLSLEEKNRLVNSYRSRMAAGPSNQSRNPPGGRGSKRNSISPGDEQSDVSMKSDSSPPANKRVRRSPEQPAPPNAVPLQQMGGLFPQQTIRATGFGPQMGAAPITQGTQQGANPQSKMNPQINQQYHNPMQGMHRMGAAGNPMPNVTNIGDGGVSTSSDQLSFGPDGSQQRSAPPLFAPGINQRPAQVSQQNKPMMPPPSSPATIGAKPSQIQGKTEGGKVESSPQSVPQGTPSNSAGTSGSSPAPPTSGQSNISSPSLTSPSRPPTATSNPPTANSLPTSGSQPTLIPPPPSSAPPGPADQLTAGFDFMSTGFDDFTSMFGREDSGIEVGGVNFEDNDFSAWFTTPEMMLDATK